MVMSPGWTKLHPTRYFQTALILKRVLSSFSQYHNIIPTPQCGNIYQALVLMPVCGFRIILVTEPRLLRQTGLNPYFLKCSILGPLLFTLCVNDIGNTVHTCNINLYADDSSLLLCLFSAAGHWMTFSRMMTRSKIPY